MGTKSRAFMSGRNGGQLIETIEKFLPFGVQPTNRGAEESGDDVG